MKTLMSAIQCATKAGRNMEARDNYMQKARESLLLADRRYYAGLARRRSSLVVGWLRLARENLP